MYVAMFTLCQFVSCRTLIKSAATLIPILGSTWIIGLFAINEHTEAFAWIFTMLNSLQVCWLYVTKMSAVWLSLLFISIGFLYIFLLRSEARKGEKSIL